MKKIRLSDTFSGTTFYEGIIFVRIESKKILPMLIWWLKKIKKQLFNWWELLPFLILKIILEKTMAKQLDPLFRYPFLIFVSFNLETIYREKGILTAFKAAQEWPNSLKEKMENSQKIV